MKMKIKWFVFSLIVIGLGLYSNVSAEVIDRIVALVNSDIVTLSQLNRETAPYMKKIADSGYSDAKQKEVENKQGEIINGDE